MARNEGIGINNSSSFQDAIKLMEAYKTAAGVLLHQFRYPETEGVEKGLRVELWNGWGLEPTLSHGRPTHTPQLPVHSIWM